MANCLFCGKELFTDRKFCSNSCCGKWHYRKNKKPIADKKCAICGDSFKPKNGGQITCGKTECQKEWRRRSEKARRDNNPDIYSTKKDEGLEKPKQKKKPSSPASKRWASMSWKELTMELDYYGLSYTASQILAEINALPEDFGLKRKRCKK